MRKTILLFLLILFSFYVHSQFFNTEMAYFGLSDISNPAYDVQNVNELEFSAFSFMGMGELTMPFVRMHVERDMHHFALAGMFNRNSVLGRYTAGFSYAYSSTGFSAGIMPYACIFDIEGSIYPVMGIRYGLVVQKELFTCGFSGGVSNRYNDGLFFMGIGMKDYEVYTAVNQQINTSIGAGLRLHLNDMLAVSAYLDTEKRISGSLKMTVLPVNIEYNAMFSEPGGLSHMVSVTYLFSGSKRNPHIEIDHLPMKLHAQVLKTDMKIPVDINSINLYDLMKIPGIGYKTALAILERRVIKGRYSNYEQLDSLPGIGEATLKTIKEYTFIGE